MVNSIPFILLLSQNLMLFDSNTILASCMTSQIMMVFFSLSGFFCMVFMSDSFIHGGKCHRPWHYDGKHILLNVTIDLLANRWCKIQLTVVPDLWISKQIQDPSMWWDAPHTMVAFLHGMNHHLSTGWHLEYHKISRRNECCHIGVYELELERDPPVQLASWTLTLVQDVGSVAAGNLTSVAHIQTNKIM